MNKKIIKELHSIATTLPPLEYAHKSSVIYSGDQLRKISPQIKAKDGKPLDSRKLYSFDRETTQANHLRALKKAYQQGGMSAVNKYVNNLKQ